MRQLKSWGPSGNPDVPSVLKAHWNPKRTSGWWLELHRIAICIASHPVKIQMLAKCIEHDQLLSFCLRPIIHHQYEWGEYEAPIVGYHFGGRYLPYKLWRSDTLQPWPLWAMIPAIFCCPDSSHLPSTPRRTPPVPERSESLSWFRSRISEGGMPTPKKIEKGFQDGIGNVSHIFFKFPTSLYIFLGLL